MTRSGARVLSLVVLTWAYVASFVQLAGTRLASDVPRGVEPTGTGRVRVADAEVPEQDAASEARREDAMTWQDLALMIIPGVTAGVAGLYGYAAGRRAERERVLGYFYDVLTNYGLLSSTANIIFRRVNGESNAEKSHRELVVEQNRRRAEKKA